MLVSIFLLYQLVYVTFKLFKFPGVLHMYLFDWYGNNFHFVFLGFIFCISLFSTLNAKLEALTFPLSGTGGISLLGSQECAPEQKKIATRSFCLNIQLQHYKKKCRSEQILSWA